MTGRVELHLHLEGAAPPAFIRGLAAEKHEDISGIFDPDGGYIRTDFAGFLKVYEAATSVLRGPEDFRRLTRAVLEESAAHHVIYSETFLSPDFCGGGDLAAWRDHLAAIEDAARDAERKDSITLRGIVTCIRHLGPEKAKRVALCAAESAGDFVRGFSIAGDETVGRLKDYAWAFDCVREAGLPLTLHAGELDGPQSVRDALEAGATRIGHGVRAAEDPALVEELAEREVVLEVCPGSNLALGLFPGWRRHPIGMLYDKGVRVTVSTDDPPFFRTNLSREYERLAEAFDWDEGVFATLNRTALEAAFCDRATKDRIRHRLEPAK